MATRRRRNDGAQKVKAVLTTLCILLGIAVIGVMVKDWSAESENNIEVERILSDNQNTTAEQTTEEQDTTAEPETTTYQTFDYMVFRDVNDTVYVTNNVNIRPEPNTTCTSIRVAKAGEKYNRTGISEEGWYRLIDTDGSVVYSSGDCYSRENENMETTETITGFEANAKAELDVKYISQLPELPNGCEVTALTTVLNYLGYNVTKETMSDDYLPQKAVGQANFYEEFVGNPRDKESFGCYAPVIVATADKYIASMGGKQKAYNMTGSSMSDLLKQVDAGNPVIVWGCNDIKKDPPLTTKWKVMGETLQWKGNLHCMVLIGYDLSKNVVIVSDPLRGIKEYDITLFIKRYKQLYSQAVVVK